MHLLDPYRTGNGIDRNFADAEAHLDITSPVSFASSDASPTATAHVVDRSQGLHRYLRFYCFDKRIQR